MSKFEIEIKEGESDETHEEEIFFNHGLNGWARIRREWKLTSTLFHFPALLRIAVLVFAMLWMWNLHDRKTVAEVVEG